MHVNRCTTAIRWRSTQAHTYRKTERVAYESYNEMKEANDDEYEKKQYDMA